MRSSRVLVTGANRTGTTWVGTVLSLAPRTILINEPLKTKYRPGVFGHEVNRWFTYICEENGREFEAHFDRLFDLRYGLIEELRYRGRRSRWSPPLRKPMQWTIGRLLKYTPIVKDPIALFSAEWLASRYDLNVIVMIRHPAAFVSSLLRYGHRPPLEDLLDQPLLMRDHLSAYREEMQRVRHARNGDLLNEAILAWNLFYSVVDQYRKSNPDWLFLRHEDVSVEPESTFRTLFEELGLHLSKGCERRMKEYFYSTRYSEIPLEAGHHFLRIDSRKNVGSWKQRLSPGQVERVRVGTAKVAAQFYGEADW